jgi:CSLREA domain-containing protein
LLGLFVGSAALAATITVNSLADPGAPGICTLRDAITAANTKTATNECASGSGNDTIQFSRTGTLLLASTLPDVTDLFLTINGPTSPGITISGGGQVRVMQVAPRATLNLNDLTIVNGLGVIAPLSGVTSGGAIFNQGTLTVASSTFSATARTWAARLSTSAR